MSLTGSSKLPIACVIPARLSSTRLSQKLLLNLHGFPVIYHTVSKALCCSIFTQVYCVTDSRVIKEVLKPLSSCKVILTASAVNGTERIAKSLSKIKEPLILNLQGDEPLINPAVLNSFAMDIQRDSTKCWVLAYKFVSTMNLHNLARVKILLKAEQVMDFVRQVPDSWKGDYALQMGLYGYSSTLLQEYHHLEISDREKSEAHEILRWKEFSFVRVSWSKEKSLSLDTKEDWDKINNFLSLKEIDTLI